MNSHEIEQLLEKFFNGETSLDEEKRLRKFFSSEEVPPKWKGIAEYFTFLGEERSINLEKQGFEEKIEESLGESRISRLIDLRRPWIYWAAGAAASLLILVAIFVKFDPFAGKINDTYDNPEVAYVQAKKILVFISSKMNKGTENLQPMEKFSEGLKDVQPVATYSKSLDGISRLSEVEKAKNRITSN
jgi:hypothetical protein